MGKQELFLKWKQLALEDLKMSELALKENLWLHAVFHCQQCVEKILKGYIVFYREVDPPYSHDLPRLLRELPELQGVVNERRLAALSVFYIHARYPDYKQKSASDLDRSQVEEFIGISRGLVNWQPAK